MTTEWSKPSLFDPITPLPTRAAPARATVSVSCVDPCLCYNAAMRMAGKSVVITGATGIAAASARRLGSEGAGLFVISRHQAELEDLAARLEQDGVDIGWYPADLTDEGETGEAFAKALDHLGNFDALLGVAGASGRRYGDGPADEMTLEAWEKTVSINLSPAFLAAREAIRVMRGGRGGSIVLVGSVLADHPSPDLFATHAYAASKGAISAFVTAAAAYYAPDGIRINGIAPGLVLTPMARRAATNPAIVAYAERKQPLASGLLDPSAVADAALFLLSDEASQITGQILAVDGGWSVTEAHT